MTTLVLESFRVTWDTSPPFLNPEQDVYVKLTIGVGSRPPNKTVTIGKSSQVVWGTNLLGGNRQALAAPNVGSLLLLVTSEDKPRLTLARQFLRGGGSSGSSSMDKASKYRFSLAEHLSDSFSLESGRSSNGMESVSAQGHMDTGRGARRSPWCGKGRVSSSF